MDFDFNDQEIGKRMFPNGCNICHSDVEFKSYMEAFGNDKDRYVYICSNSSCGAYTIAHNETLGDAIKYMPQGILASVELRSVHDALRYKFNQLWQQKKIDGICHDFVLSFTAPSGDTMYGKVHALDKENKLYTIITETEDVFNVPINMTRKVDSRTRSYFWLATMLKIPMRHCQIPMFNYEQTSGAYDIVVAALKDVDVENLDSITK